MMRNGGGYRTMRLMSPAAIQQMKLVPGHDRFDPDKTIRWGVGMKMFDSDGMSDKASGSPGANGSFVKVDPTCDLVVSMVRGQEGKDYLKRRGGLTRTILDSIQRGE